MSVEEKQQFIIDELSRFSDWSERYKQIIKIGRELGDMPEDLKTDENLVKGCQSLVWLNADLDGDKVVFSGDSDALIVKGLLALLLRVYSGEHPQEIVSTKPRFLDELGLTKHLSVTRSNGLMQMIKQIKFYGMAYDTLLQRSKN